MKKVLSFILAVMMLLGCMSITAFAKGNNTSVINATLPKMSYTIIIPSETTLTEDVHANVLMGGASGKATITVDKHGSAKENVYYTVDLTNANLADADGHTITTSYTYAQGGDYTALTSDTKVTVYTGGKVVDSTIKVTADDTEWMAAPSGDYTASVVFNFVKEDAAPTFKTIGDILNTVPAITSNSPWKNGTTSMYIYPNYGELGDVLVFGSNFWQCSLTVEKIDDNTYTCSDSDIKFTFNLSVGVLNNVAVEVFSQYISANISGTYTAPQK